MKRSSSVLGACAFSLLFSPTPAAADGFNYSEHSACASGIAGTFIARACPNDPASLFYNPAAATLISGTRISLGGALLWNRSEYRYASPFVGPVTIDDENDAFLPVHVFATHPLTDRITAGLGVFMAYGLGTRWPVTPENVGRFVSYSAEVRSFYVQPTVAARVSSTLAVGAGLDFAYTRAELNRLVDLREIEGTESLDPATYPPLTYSAADALLSADGWSVGFILSVLYEPSRAVSLGARYLSQTTVELRGRMRLLQTPVADQGAPDADVIDAIVAAALPPDPLPGKTRLTLPDQLVIGAELRPIARWTFAVGYLWTNWADFDTLVVRVEGQAPDTLAPSYGNSSLYRVGVAYEAAPRLTLRAGFMHDPTPANPAEPFGVGVLLPDATRNDLSLGVGWRWSPRVRADLFWLAVFFNETEGCVVPTTAECVIPAERFRTTAHLVGTTIQLAL